MFNHLIDEVIKLINTFGLWGVFFASIIEEVIAPIPSPLVMMSAGAAMLGEHSSISGGLVMEMSIIALVGSIGATIGSYVPYFAAYYGGKPIIEKTGKFTGLKWKFIEKIQEKLDKSKSDEITIGALRAIPVMPSIFIAATCGVMRVNFYTYSLSFFVGGIIRALIFLIVGWQLGSAYEKGAEVFENISDIVQILVVLLFLAGFAYLYWKRGQIEKSIEEEN